MRLLNVKTGQGVLFFIKLAFLILRVDFIFLNLLLFLVHNFRLHFLFSGGGPRQSLLNLGFLNTLCNQRYLGQKASKGSVLRFTRGEM